MSDRTCSQYHRELVLLFLLIFFALTTSPRPPAGSMRIPPAAAVYPPSFSMEEFRQQSAFLVNKGAYTHCISPSARLFN